MKKRILIISVLLFLLLLTVAFTACGDLGDKSEDDGDVVITYYLAPNSDPINMTIYDGEFSLLKIPQRKGYEFLGLYDSTDGGSQVVNAQGQSNVQIQRSITLYAQWRAKTYTVTFVPNSGTMGAG